MKKKSWILFGHQGDVNSLGFSPNGNLLATVGNDKLVRLWSNSQSKSVPINIVGSNNNNAFLFKTFHGALQSINFSPDSKLIATSTKDGGVQFWTLNGQQIADFTVHQQKIRSADFSRDGLWFATASEDGTAIIWKVRSLHDLLKQGCSWLKYYLDTYPTERNKLPICTS